MKKDTNKKDLFGKANYDEQLVKGIKIAIGVILFLVVVYLLTALATGEIKFGDKDKEKITESTIQYEEIIAGQILNRMEDEYYVLAFDFTDDNTSYYLSLKDSYELNIDAIGFYLVDLEKGFNQAIIASDEEEYTEKPSDITDLKVKAPTLFKVVKGKVTERTEGTDAVIEKLEKIAK